MGRTRQILRTAGLIGFLFLVAVPAGGERAWAQAPPALEGTYAVRQRFVGPDPAPLPAGFPRRLHLLRDREYVWGVYRHNYVVPPPGRVIQLLCHWTGDINPANRQLTFEVRHNGLLQRYILEYEGTLDAIPPPQPLPGKKGCEGASGSGPNPGAVAGIPAGWRVVTVRAQPATAQTQAAPVRIVDGELLLALRRDGSSPADIRLWTCFVTRGYPGIELVEAGAAPVPVFVWPDARFRAEVRGGAAYEWWLRTTECETEGRQPGGVVRVPPFPPATAEKVVLACFVEAGRFSRCHQWWLVRP